MVTASRLDSTLYTHVLPNGLQLLGQHIPDVESAVAVFWVKTGARDENPQHNGVSHFLEHMAFKRTKTRTYEDINREFEEMGAENNAFTWLEMTAYWARVLGDNLNWAIELLSELTHPVLDATDFDQERNVILEEIALYQDRPQYLLIDQLLQDTFKDQPLGQPTLGTPETIKGLTVEDMRAYWERRYGANNILFAVAGNFDWDTVVDHVAALTEDWHQSPAGRQLAPLHYTPSIDVKTNERWNQEHIALAMPSVARGDPRQYAAGVLATILGDDTGSRLFWSVYQKGLAEQIGAQNMAFDDSGLMLVSASTEPEKARETVATIRHEIEALQGGEISDDELERAKVKLMASVVIGGESTRERMMGLIDSWLTHERLETLDDIRRRVESVTAADIRDLLDEFPLTAQPVMTALGPLERDALGV